MKEEREIAEKKARQDKAVNELVAKMRKEAEQRAIEEGKKEQEIIQKEEPLLAKNTKEMNGYEFEEYCAELLRRNEFINVSVTQGSGDYGIDIIAEKDGLRFGIQCKCYSSAIGVKAVQEASTGCIYYSCDRAVVMTNNEFTAAAINMARRTSVELWDRNIMKELIRNIEKETVLKVRKRDEQTNG